MSSWGSLNGERIVSASLAIPMYGTWAADVVLAASKPLAMAAVLTFGEITLSGVVQRLADFSGSQSARLVGGFGGWQKPIPARAYNNPSGLSLSMVLGDAATEVGETVRLAADSSLGAFFVREHGPAQRVLRQLAGPLWWVDLKGVTQVGPRPSGAIGSPFEVISWSASRGLFEIATETLSDWLPGRTFSSSTVAAVQTVSFTALHVGNDGKARLEILTTP